MLRLVNTHFDKFRTAFYQYDYLMFQTSKQSKSHFRVLHRTIFEPAIFSCKRFEKKIYNNRIIKVWENSKSHGYVHKHIRFFEKPPYDRSPCISILEEVVSWVYENLPLQAWHYFRIDYHGTTKKDVCSIAVRHLFYCLIKQKSMHFFIKLLDDRHDWRITLLLENPLLLALMVTGALRSWKYPNKSPDWLEQWEFTLSKNEYATFGLQSSQSWKVARALEKLISLWFMKKCDKKTATKQSTIYRLLDYEIITPYFIEQPPNSHEIDIKQSANSHNNKILDTRNKKLDKRNNPTSSLNSIGGGLEGEKDWYKQRMFKVENEWKEFILNRNTLTGRNDRMDEKTKKALYNIIETITLEDFISRISVFAKVLNITKEHRLGKYLFFKIEFFDLGEFLNHINKFYGTLDDVFGRLTIEQERKHVVSKVRAIISPPPRIPEKWTDPPISQEAKDRIKEIKDRLIKKTTFT